MAAYGSDGRCLMRVLQEELDDPAAGDCGRCSVCTSPRFADAPASALVEQAGRHLRSQPVRFEVKKMAPDPSGTMRKIPDEVRTEPGLALARFGDGGWWPAVERGMAAGALEEEVIAGLAEALGGAGITADWVTAVPSVHAGAFLENAAARLADRLGVPHVRLLTRADDRPPQREMANAVAQTANVRGAFRVVGRPPSGTGVVLDDRRSSGWTLAMVGGQLRRAGAGRIVPCALATIG
jgi:ATP-dependent DNA helicase RecQ